LIVDDIMKFLLDSEGQIEADTWQIISRSVACLENPIPDQIDLRMLFTPPVHEKLATVFLQRRKADKTWQHLSTDQLIAISSKVETAEIDIQQSPGVYIFCSLVRRTVLKVGQTSNMRRRIALEHLRKGSMNTNSLLIDHAQRNWSVAQDAVWHESLNANEVTALTFPMYGSGEVDRLLIELSLKAMLHPEMP
jgi:hypothetical protein